MRVARNGTTFVDSAKTNSQGSSYVWLFENAASGLSVRRDSASVLSDGTVTNVTSHQWAVGNRFGDTQYSDAKFYGLVGIKRTLTTAEIEATESYLATKSGVTLP
jgi:hypothetical protein